MGKTEAIQTDPQHRVMLECCYEALDDAGLLLYQGQKQNFPLDVGCFLSSGSLPHYLTDVLVNDLGKLREQQPSEYWKIECGNDKDYLATRISYKLNLTGPSEVIQTACSSSLVAINNAVEAIKSGRCSAAIAGGVSLDFPQNSVVKHEEGMIWSADGHCRPFDEQAGGTVRSNACGAVVLMTKNDLMRLQNHRKMTSQLPVPYAKILGHCVNNDGRRKAAFFAPSVDGQKEVILGSLKSANIKPSDVRFIEGHGTATPLGDPIEVEALTQALTSEVDPKNNNEKFNCVLGSVKGNVGHANTAAGVVGFIKAVLTCKNKEIPPTCNFEKRNPNIPDTCPFKILGGKETISLDFPHIVGVSSFGIGGTNAHLTLQSIEENNNSNDDKDFGDIANLKKLDLDEKTAKNWESYPRNPRETCLLIFSGPIAQSCVKQAIDIFSILKNETPENIKKSALGVSLALKRRNRFSEYRSYYVLDLAQNGEEIIKSAENMCVILQQFLTNLEESLKVTSENGISSDEEKDSSDSINRLSDNESDDLPSSLIPKKQVQQIISLQGTSATNSSRPVILLFPGQGSEYPNLAQNLIGPNGFDVFHFHYENVAKLFSKKVAPLGQQEKTPFGSCSAVFCVSYAMAKALLPAVCGGDFNVRPHALLGHSLGEWVAAAVSGVVSLEDAVQVVEKRAEICGKLGGKMTAIRADVDTVKFHLEKSPNNFKDLCDIACVNGSKNGPVILAGLEENIAKIEEYFDNQNFKIKRLTTHGAFHSRFLDPFLQEFKEILLKVTLSEPKIPIISTATGKYLTPAQAVSHVYWVSQLIKRHGGVWRRYPNRKRKFTTRFLPRSRPGHDFELLSRK